MTLKEVVDKARSEGKAIGHFNISDIAAARAIVRAAGDVGVPVIIGTSEGEAEFVDLDVAVALVKDMKKETEQDIFLNADHFKSKEKALEAAKAGYDSVIFDAAKFPLEENIGKTAEAVSELKKLRGDLVVEGEVGYIGESSKVLDAMPEGAGIAGDALPKAEDVERYVRETGVDFVAPAVGNIHGMFKNSANPSLDIGLIEEIASATNAPIVLHGGSGITDADFRDAIRAGVSIVHINTEIRLAWKEGMEKGLEDEDQIAPYKIFPAAEKAVYEVVSKRLKLFSGLL